MTDTSSVSTSHQPLVPSKKRLAASVAVLALAISGCVCTTATPVTHSAGPAASNDSDQDGVAGAYDRCPGTARGVEVDRNGCAIVSKITLVDLNFEFGSAKLRPTADSKLENVASAMKANDKMRIEVAGHTDSVGSDKYNQGLSERRARSARDRLAKEGIEADRIDVKGYGKSMPIDTNDTDAGRANNRRVEFKVLQE